MEPIPFWQSKTILINALIAVALAVLGVLGPATTWDKAVWVAAAVAGLNALLRFTTGTPIKNTPAATAQAQAIEAVRTETVQQLTKQFETVQRVRDGVQINGPTVARNIAGHTIHEGND